MPVTQQQKESLLIRKEPFLKQSLNAGYPATKGIPRRGCKCTVIRPVSMPVTQRQKESILSHEKNDAEQVSMPVTQRQKESKQTFNVLYVRKCFNAGYPATKGIVLC